VMFVDIVGFTRIATSRPPREVVNMLNDLFSRIDASCKVCGAVKIKTIGDAYLAVTGMDGSPDHASTMADLALEVREAVHKYSFLTNNKLDIRIGIHTGKVVGGIIGRETSHFDIWGETVNLASRLESHGMPGKIQVSEAFADLVHDRFSTSERGLVNLKGFGELSCLLLDGPKTEINELENPSRSA
jgi:adenylate cyclase